MTRPLKTLLPVRRRGSLKELDFLIIEPSSMCNLRCTTCPIHTYESPRGLMADSVFSQLKPFLAEVPRVALDGWGEPLTDPKIFERTRICHDTGCYTQFATNATLLTEKNVPNLLDSGLDLLLVSVDGASKETFESIRRGADFDQVIGNVRSVIAARNLNGLKKPAVSLIYTLTRANKHEAVTFAKMAAKLQVDSICIKQLDVWAKEADLRETVAEEDCSTILAGVEDCLRDKLTKLEPVSKWYMRGVRLNGNCYGNSAHAAFISWQGDVSPCCNLGHRGQRLIKSANGQHSSTVNSFFSFGNISREGLDRIWNKESYRSLRKSIAAGSVPQQCVGCNLI